MPSRNRSVGRFVKKVLGVTRKQESLARRLRLAEEQLGEKDERIKGLEEDVEGYSNDYRAINNRFRHVVKEKEDLESRMSVMRNEILRLRGFVPEDKRESEEIREHVLQELRKERTSKIHAIKAYRDVTGFDLREAKMAVDALMEEWYNDGSLSKDEWEWGVHVNSPVRKAKME